VGEYGNGTYNLSAGVVNIGTTSNNYFLQIGDQGTGKGNFILGGTGSLNTIGFEEIGAFGQGTFTHNAGTNTIGSATTVGTLVMGNAGIGSGTYLLSAGALNVLGSGMEF